MAHWRESTWATSRFDARRNASGRLVAPERRISSCVMTWMAEAVSDNFSGRFDTEVTSMSISSSTLNFFNALGGGRASCVWAEASSAKMTRPKATNVDLEDQARQKSCLSVKL